MRTTLLLAVALVLADTGLAQNLFSGPAPPKLPVSRRVATTPLPPMPPGMVAQVVQKKKPGAKLRAKEVRHIGSFSNAYTRVIFGELPKSNLLFRPSGEEAPKDLLHTTITYENDVPVDFNWSPSGPPNIVLCDIVTITAHQVPNFGVVMEYTDDRWQTYNVTGVWGTYPFAQPVSVIWLRSDADVQSYYPKVFFRSYKFL